MEDLIPRAIFTGERDKVSQRQWGYAKSWEHSGTPNTKTGLANKIHIAVVEIQMGWPDRHGEAKQHGLRKGFPLIWMQ